MFVALSATNISQIRVVGRHAAAVTPPALTVRMQDEAAIAASARHQHGLVTAAQAAAAGVDRSAARRRVESGRWEPLQRGVYAVAGSPRTFEQRLLAGCLATAGAASHRAGMLLLSFDPPEQVVEVLVAAERSPRRPGVVVHRTNELRPEWLTERQGIPVTGPLRLLADVGAVCPPWYVERCLEQGIVRKMFSFEGAVGAYFQLSKQGRNGVGVLRAALESWGHGSVQPDSVLEAAFARLCRRADLPLPVLQYEIEVGGRRRRLDAAWPGLRVAVEVDGFASRVNRTRFQDDRSRQNDLVRSGWTVLRFTWEDVMQRPEMVASQIRAVLRTVGGAQRHKGFGETLGG
jgi:hypothetical protein